MRKLTDLSKYSKDELFLINNGFWELTEDEHYDYTIIGETEKWRELVETCIRECKLKEDGIIKIKIITPEIFFEILKKGKIRRDVRKSNVYIKIKNRDK